LKALDFFSKSKKKESTGLETGRWSAGEIIEHWTEIIKLD
jgi:hypothetical protein